MKKVLLKNLQNLKNTCAGVAFSIKLQTGSLQCCYKGTLAQVSSRILQNFQKYVFCETPANEYFYIVRLIFIFVFIIFIHLI